MKPTRFAPAVAALAASLSLAATAGAQVPDTVLGTHLITAGTLRVPRGDTLAVDLRKGAIYRIGVWPASARIKVFAAARPNQALFAPRVSEGDVRRVTAIELYPQSTGRHLLVGESVPPDAATRIWVWEDTAAEATARARSQSRWRVGFGGEWVSTSRYAIARDSQRIGASYPAANLLLAGGRTVLAVGLADEQRAADTSSVLWVFLEVRYRLSTLVLAGHALDTHGVVMLAQGTSTPSTNDPSVGALGIMLSYHLDRRPGVRGLVFGGQLLYGSIGNLNFGRDQSLIRGALSFSWIP